MEARDNQAATSTTGVAPTEKPRRRGFGSIGRRGFAAGAVALLATLTAHKATEREAEATTGDTMRVGLSHIAETTTGILGRVPSNYVLALANDQTNGSALYAEGSGGTGVFTRTSGIGVVAISTGASNGVYAVSSGGGVAVGGIANTNYGVSGISSSQYGVNGESTTNVGVNGSGTTGVRGSGTSFGVIGASAGTAGLFQGAVIVQGDFTATGIKSAAVRDASGNLRRYYCVESTLSYFEDIGQGQTGAGGAVSVPIESAFGSTVDTNGYYVFLTEVGDYQQLYVESQSPTGFVVRSKVGAVGAKFIYRVMARRKDISNQRLASVTVPTPPARIVKPNGGMQVDRLPANVPKPPVTSR